MTSSTMLFEKIDTPGGDNLFVRIGAVCLVLLVFTVPFSTAISIVMSFLIFGCWILSGQFRNLPSLLRDNSVAASAAFLYGLLVIGSLYADSDSADSAAMLRKFRELPLLLVLIPFLQGEKYRDWAMKAFIAACVITLLGSYLKIFEVIPLHKYGAPTFKSRITHNVLMGFFAYFCICRASIAGNRRWLWYLLGLLAIVNITIFVEGRTGQVAFIFLMVLYLFKRVRSKNALLSVGFILILAIGVVVNTENRFKEGIENTKEYFSGNPNLTTSMGQRLYFWETALQLIRERPVFGYGTGSYASEFERIAGANQLLSQNPHNEYLMITVQLGVVGLASYVLFIACMWHRANLLPYEQGWFAQGVVVSLATNSLFNSTFLDHTEGHLYACLIALSFAVMPARQRVAEVTNKNENC